jgi:hypothetical protein
MECGEKVEKKGEEYAECLEFVGGGAAAARC